MVTVVVLATVFAAFWLIRGVADIVRASEDALRPGGCGGSSAV